MITVNFEGPATLERRFPGIFESSVSGTLSNHETIDRFTPRTYVIDWGDGSPLYHSFGGHHGYNEAGTYLPTVTVTFSETGEVASASLTVVVS